jgi:hypothetical protein
VVDVTRLLEKARQSADRAVIVESTINQLVAKRFVKKQQMRWTPRGAHLLLQIRVQELNDDLHTNFKRWYPSLRNPPEARLAA